MKKCIIFSGGDFDITEISTENSVIICADSGYLHAEKLNIIPDFIVGDFDSLGYIPNSTAKIIKHKPEKDDTDTILAIKIAIENNCNYIEIYGALGGRYDHIFANLQSLKFALENGVNAVILSQNERIELLENGTIFIEQRENYSLSIFSLTDKSKGVTADGVKYPMLKSELSSGFPLGVSNEITASKAKITVEDGVLLIIQSKIL